MFYVKILGLLAVAAVALTAFTGVASASTATSPAGTAYTGKIEATAGKSFFKGSFAEVVCTSATLKGQVTSHGAGLTVDADLYHIASSGCNYEVTTTITAGTLTIHGFGGGNATVTSTGMVTTAHTSLGTCVFTTNNTDLGTLKGGSPATLEIASAAIPRTGGNFLCGSSGTWTATYTVSNPKTLLVS
jgi:hypothetical protein